MTDTHHLDPTLLASHADPRPALTRLASQPPYRLDDGRWIVGRPAEVAAVLEDPVAIVEAPSGHPALAEVIGTMARFSEGHAHAHRREQIERALADLDPDDLRRRAATRAGAALAGHDAIHVIALARRVPAETLADAVGVPDPEASVAAVDLLVRSLAPGRDEHDRPPDSEVAAALHDAGPLDPTVTAVLFQAIDATAALVTSSLLDDDAPPLILTTRRLVEPLHIAGVSIPADAQVVVVLGAVAHTTEPDAVFGHGRHACPGRHVARALAAGVVDALRGWGTVATGTDPGTWQARPNLRLPVELWAYRNHDLPRHRPDERTGGR